MMTKEERLAWRRKYEAKRRAETDGTAEFITALREFLGLAPLKSESAKRAGRERV